MTDRAIDHFLFDLDGTVTTEELLPRIARTIGVEAQIADLTARTIAGDVPFEVSLRHRVAILSKASVSTIQDIVAGVGLDPDIMAFLESNASRCSIVTGNVDVWLLKLRDRLGVPVLSSTSQVRDDRLMSLSKVMNKGEIIGNFSGSLCAIGDGYNDIEMIAAADVGVAYGGVHAPAKPLLEVADYAAYSGKILCQFLSRL